MNSKASEVEKQGIGFGGRIWLDRDIVNKSYVRSEDGTYESGPLT